MVCSAEQAYFNLLLERLDMGEKNLQSLRLDMHLNEEGIQISAMNLLVKFLVYCFYKKVSNHKAELDKLSPTEHKLDQISRSVMSDSLRPHELQHARPPCPSPTPGVHSDSRPSSQ